VFFFSALYSMSAGLYGGGGAGSAPSSLSATPTTLGVAASQAQSLGLNPSSKYHLALMLQYRYFVQNQPCTSSRKKVTFSWSVFGSWSARKLNYNSWYCNSCNQCNGTGMMPERVITRLGFVILPRSISYEVLTIIFQLTPFPFYPDTVFVSFQL
jgi:hypothetical protein